MSECSDPTPANGEDESTPLRGCSIILTRPRQTAEETARLLRSAGAEVLEAPAIEFTGLVEENFELYSEALKELREAGGWLILPSPTAICYFKEVMSRIALGPAALAGIRVATIGEAGARRLSEAGYAVDFLPSAAQGQALAETLPAAPGERVLIAGSREGRPELTEGLRRRGMRVSLTPLYAPRPCPGGLRAIRDKLAEGGEHWLVLASPSAVDALMGFMAHDEVLLDRAKWIVIGPTTYQRLLTWRIQPARVAQAFSPSAQGLLQAAKSLLAGGHGAPPRQT